MDGAADAHGVAWTSKTIIKHHDDVSESERKCGDLVGRTAKPGDSVSVHFIAQSVATKVELLNTRELLQQPFELRMGRAFVVPELEQAVESMMVGETARFIFRKEIMPQFAQLATVLRRSRRFAAESACGSESGHSCCAHALKNDKESEALRDALGSDLALELELVKVEAGGTFDRQSWELSWSEKVQAVLDHKIAGNTAVGRKEYADAARQYEIAIGLLESLRLATKTEELDESVGVGTALEEHVPLLLNYTLCMLKLSNFSSAVEHATSVLRIDPTNTKALFRRGQAHLERGRDIDLALADLDRAHELQPENSAIKHLLHKCKRVVARAAAEDRQRFAGMFGS